MKLKKNLVNRRNWFVSSDQISFDLIYIGSAYSHDLNNGEKTVTSNVEKLNIVTEHKNKNFNVPQLGYAKSPLSRRPRF